MVKYPEGLDRVFRALADPTRRRMLEIASRGEAAVSTLVRPGRVSLAGAAKHVRVLERAGLLVTRKVGRERRCRLRPGGLRAAVDWMRRHRAFWEVRLEALGEFLEANKEEEDGGQTGGLGDAS